MPKLTPCLWLDTEDHAAAQFYCGIFPNFRITNVSTYPEGSDRAGQPLVVTYELDGQEYAALNGGPDFHFTEAISVQIDCADQAEVDHYWQVLGEAGSRGRAAG